MTPELRAASERAEELLVSVYFAHAAIESDQPALALASVAEFGDAFWSDVPDVLRAAAAEFARVGQEFVIRHDGGADRLPSAHAAWVWLCERCHGFTLREVCGLPVPERDPAEVAGWLERWGIHDELVDAVRVAMFRERAKLAGERPALRPAPDGPLPAGTVVVEADVPAAYRYEGRRGGPVLTRKFLKGDPLNLFDSFVSRAEDDGKLTHHIKVRPASGRGTLMTYLWTEIQALRREKTEREADRPPGRPRK